MSNPTTTEATKAYDAARILYEDLAIVAQVYPCRFNSIREIEASKAMTEAWAAMRFGKAA